MTPPRKRPKNYMDFNAVGIELWEVWTDRGVGTEARPVFYLNPLDRLGEPEESIMFAGMGPVALLDHGEAQDQAIRLAGFFPHRRFAVKKKCC